MHTALLRDASYSAHVLLWDLPHYCAARISLLRILRLPQACGSREHTQIFQSRQHLGHQRDNNRLDAQCFALRLGHSAFFPHFIASGLYKKYLKYTQFQKVAFGNYCHSQAIPAASQPFFNAIHHMIMHACSSKSAPTCHSPSCCNFSCSQIE